MALAYQLLALDPGKKTRCEDAASLIYQIRGFTALWKAPKIQETDHKLIDGSASLLIVPATADESDKTEDANRSFIITLTGNYGDIEPKREPLAAFLKDIDFDLIERLSSNNLLDVYHVQHPVDPAKQTAALRRPTQK